MRGLLTLLAALTGVASGVQPGINASLGKAAGPIVAALLSVAVSAAALVAGGLASGRMTLPSRDQLAAAPWWAWTGGVLGASIVLGQLLIAQPLGSAVFMGINVTAALVVSLVLDHFALLGFQEHAINAGRVAGALLMIGGVVLIARY